MAPQPPRRELRIAFAMGGGVSLGTFSGAALSQALKLAILRGCYMDNGQQKSYDHVVVDVFSGASAGAMSLGIMLRSLINRDPELERKAEARLREEFKDEFERAPAEKRAQLIAAEVMQAVQEQVWCRDITIERLLGQSIVGGKPGPQRDLEFAGGLLDRGAIEDIARETLSFPPEVCKDNPSFRAGLSVLGERVLYACAVSNLTSILQDARKDLGSYDGGLLGLADGLTSRKHREARIFDLSFETLVPGEVNPADFPMRWCRYHCGDEIRGVAGDIKSYRTWSRIGATMIAAGAFPFAFEPVVLRRRKYEYGETLWPAGDLEETLMTYVDGGVFNNEPIREAFRLAAFMDARIPDRWRSKPEERWEFDRRVIFVDPNIAPPETNFRIEFHRRYSLKKPGFEIPRNWDRVRHSTLDRLVPYLGSLAGAIMDESQAIEGDGVFLTRKRFELRDDIRGFVAEIIASSLPDEVFDNVVDYICQTLAADRTGVLIPPGTLQLATELARVVDEEPLQLAPALGSRVNSVPSDPAAAKRFFASEPAEARTHWIQALIYVALDLAMDLEGKRKGNRLIAIGPLEKVPVDAVPKPQFKDEKGQWWRIVDLPGGRVAGFGGFTSRHPGAWEVRFARGCAQDFLESADLITPATPVSVGPFENAAAYEQDLARGVNALADRVGSAIKQSHLVDIFPGITGAVLGILAGRVEKELRNISAPVQQKIRFEIRVYVPNTRFAIHGGFGKDLAATVLPDGPDPVILLDAEVDVNTGDWISPFIKRAELDKQWTIAVEVDGHGPLPDSHFCAIAMPPLDVCALANRKPLPTFVVTIGDDDRDKVVPDTRWDISAGVVSLEDGLISR
jgi:predicted acylesterase/phospholipase RssA